MTITYDNIEEYLMLHEATSKALQLEESSWHYNGLGGIFALTDMQKQFAVVHSPFAVVETDAYNHSIFLRWCRVDEWCRKDNTCK